MHEIFKKLKYNISNKANKHLLEFQLSPLQLPSLISTEGNSVHLFLYQTQLKVLQQIEENENFQFNQQVGCMTSYNTS